MALEIENPDESKLLTLVKNFADKSVIETIVEFHFKMLYSVNKNKKTPTYMLKSILISLSKLEFNKDDFKERAKELLAQFKPNCYQAMIDIFKLHNEMDFFEQLVNEKMKEQKYKDVVFVCNLFPAVLEKLHNPCPDISI